MAHHYCDTRVNSHPRRYRKTMRPFRTIIASKLFKSMTYSVPIIQDAPEALLIRILLDNCCFNSTALLDYMQYCSFVSCKYFISILLQVPEQRLISNKAILHHFTQPISKFPTGQAFQN